MKRLIIIPAYNEQSSICKTIENIEKYAPEYDYIVINDASTDETYMVCRENGINVLNLSVNLGIGGAVQTGYLYAKNNGYEIAVQIDGDGQHSAEYLHSMEKELLDNDNDMVIGSRFITKKGFQSSIVRRIGIRYFSLLIKMMTGKYITDPTSGMRMVNGKLIDWFAKNYPKDYPEPDSIVSVLWNNCKVGEVPVLMQEREFGKSSIGIRNSIYYGVKVSIAILLAHRKV